MAKRLIIDHANHITEMLHDIAQRDGYEFKSWPDDSLGNDWKPIECALAGKEFAVRFMVQQMPGCCAILVLSYIRVNPYSQENFDKVVQIVEEAAKDAAFGSVAMTQVVPNFSQMFWKEEPWIKCLDRNWKAGQVFRNGKSGNIVTYLLKDLEQKEQKEGFETRYWANIDPEMKDV